MPFSPLFFLPQPPPCRPGRPPGRNIRKTNLVPLVEECPSMLWRFSLNLSPSNYGSDLDPIVFFSPSSDPSSCFKFFSFFPLNCEAAATMAVVSWSLFLLSLLRSTQMLLRQSVTYTPGQLLQCLYRFESFRPNANFPFPLVCPLYERYPLPLLEPWGFFFSCPFPRSPS